MNNLRAWFKPDFDTKDGALKFNLEIIPNDSAWFVCESDGDIKYPIETPFINEDWIIEKSTGLKDRNGMEIFERDLIKVETHSFFEKENFFFSAKVEWEDGEWCIRKTGFHGHNGSLFMNKKCEIIGNLHQNNLDGSPKK